MNLPTKPCSRVPSLLVPFLAAAMFGVSGCYRWPATDGSLLGTTVPAPTPVTTVAGVTAKSIYVCDQQNQQIDIYAANESGTVTPTTIQVGCVAVAADGAGNIYAAGDDVVTGGHIAVIAAGTTSVAKTIQLPAETSASQNQINSITIDAAGNLYVASSANIIFVYAPSAGAGSSPVRTIAGAMTTLTGGSVLGVNQMVVDPAGDLYVSEGGGYPGSKVVMFPPGANGNVAPTVMTSTAYLPTGVTLDAAGNMYITQSIYEQSTTGYATGIYEFAAGAGPLATAIRSITGSNTDLGFYTHNIHVDSAGNIFVLIYISEFVEFAPSASGNVAPEGTILRTVGTSLDSQFYLQ